MGQAQPKMCHSPKVKDRVENQMLPFLNPYFGHTKKTLNGHISSTIKPFDPILKLRATPQYQLPFDVNSLKVDTKSTYKPALGSQFPPLIKWLQHTKP